MARVYEITGSGLRAIPARSGLIFRPGTACYIGASSSPERIIVTGIEEDWLRYRRAYDPRAEARIERDIGEDLIRQGSRTKHDNMARLLRSPRMADAPPAWMVAERDGLRRWLDGGEPIIEDWHGEVKVRVIVRSAADGVDHWYDLERWTCTQGGVDGGFDVEVRAKDLDAVRALPWVASVAEV